MDPRCHFPGCGNEATLVVTYARPVYQELLCDEHRWICDVIAGRAATGGVPDHVTEIPAPGPGLWRRLTAAAPLGVVVLVAAGLVAVVPVEATAWVVAGLLALAAVAGPVERRWRARSRAGQTEAGEG